MWDVPFVGVNHLEAHLYAALLEDPTLELPVVVLLVSGGHTMLVRWRTTAATGCSARPSTTPRARRSTRSPATSASATPAVRPSTGSAMEGDPTAIGFPRAMLDDGYDFSFSGLKTAVVNYVRKHPDVSTADVCASFQEAVVDVLVTKARRAAAAVGAKGMCLGGGVAANSQLRERFLDACIEDGLPRLPAEPGDVHRQRRDGRGRRLVAAPRRRPDPPRRRRRPQPALPLARERLALRVAAGRSAATARQRVVLG